MTYELNGKIIPADEEGYLLDVSYWNPELASIIAKHEEIEMTDDAWEVFNFLRSYYEEYQIAPGARILTKAIKTKLGADKSNSCTCMVYSPTDQAAKAAK